MNAAKTPTVAVARVLRGLGLVQGDDFRVTGQYRTTGGTRERIGSYVVVLSRRADDIIAANADAIQDATAAEGFSFCVSVYYSGSGRVFTSVRNFGDTVRQAAPAAKQTEAAAAPAVEKAQPVAAPVATSEERAVDVAHLIGRSFTKQRTDYQTEGWPTIERTARVLAVLPDYLPAWHAVPNVGVHFVLTDVHRPDGVEQSLTLDEFRQRWMDGSTT